MQQSRPPTSGHRKIVDYSYLFRQCRQTFRPRLLLNHMKFVFSAFDIEDFSLITCTSISFQASHLQIARIHSTHARTLGDDTSFGMDNLTASKKVAEEAPGGARLQNIPMRTREAQIRCVSCLQTFPNTEIARAPCKHCYCASCLRSMLEVSFGDIGLFPPRCCKQVIPLDLLSPPSKPLDPSLLARYKAMEHNQKTKGDFHCFRPTCSTVIPQSSIQDTIGICPKCNSKMCTNCTTAAHQGPCPEDSGVPQLQRLAGEKGWSRCKQCNHLVELSKGCNHISKSNIAYCSARIHS